MSDIEVNIEPNRGMYLLIRKVGDMKELLKGKIFVDIENYRMIKPDCNELIKFYDSVESNHLYDTIQIDPKGLEFSREHDFRDRPGSSNLISVVLHRVKWEELEYAANAKSSYKKGKLAIPSYAVKRLLEMRST